MSRESVTCAVDGVQCLHEAPIAEHGARAVGERACVLDSGDTEALVGKSTYERRRAYVSLALPNLTSVEDPGKTKLAAANGDTVTSLAKATAPLRLVNGDG